MGAVLAMLAGCSTTPPPDIGGRWKAVNRFAQTTTEIPLHARYVYQATPMDGTLKSMLERWARDSGMALDYRLSSDYTLYGAVAGINTSESQQAMAALSAAYAGQGISVSIEGNRIVVQAAGVSTAAEPIAGSSDSGS